MTTAGDRAPISDTAGGAGSWVGSGLLAGFLAGIVFIALNSWFAASMGKPQLAPFKTVATIIQGPPPPHATIWVGMVVHAVLSAIFGLVFAALMTPLRARFRGSLVWAGLIYGAVIYIVDFQVLSRLVPHFSAFIKVTSQPLELSVHLVFGAILAALLLSIPTHRSSESVSSAPAEAPAAGERRGGSSPRG